MTRFRISCFGACSVTVAMLVASSPLIPVAHAQCASPSWTRGADAPNRPGHSAAYDAARHKMILFGGTIPFCCQFGDETWELDGNVWTRLHPVTTPPGRYELHNMTYDSVRQRTVMYGGFQFPAAFDTWEFDGTNWSQRAADGPRVTDGFAVAYDSARQRVVLFGGQPEDFQQPFSNQTWLWDGTTWTQASPATSPPGLRYCSLAYDSDRQRVVLFGGRFSNGTDSNQTWEWDGTNWTQRVIAGPSAASNVPLAYDSLRHKTIAAFRSPLQHETWELDGAGWTLVPLAPSLCGPGLTGTSLVFDSDLGRSVLVYDPNSLLVPSTTFVYQIPGPPTILKHPIGGEFAPGQTMTLNVDAGCVFNNTYQWKQGTTNLADFISPGGLGGVHGSTGPQLQIYGTALTSARSGSYTCVVTGLCGNATSNPAEVVVGCDPTMQTYQIPPTQVQFILSAFDGSPLANAILTLIGTFTVQFDPNCPSTEGTTGQITDINWNATQASVPMNWVGGTATLNNLHAEMNASRGTLPAPAILDNDDRTFEQTGAALALDGTMVYNAFGLDSTLNLSTAPPLPVAATASAYGAAGLDIHIPFDSDYEVDAGLGGLNPRLRMIADIIGTHHTCPADLDNGTGTGTGDSAVTIDDLLYFLVQFEAGSTAADLDNGSGTGTHDQAVTIDDLLYFLVHFEAGC